MKYVRFWLFSLVLYSTHGFANSPFPDQISFMTGNIGVSYAETESTLVSTDGTPQTESSAYSNSVTAMPLFIEYEHFATLRRSYFVNAAGPLMASTPDRVFAVNGGAHFYLNRSGSIINLSTDQLSLVIAPSFRYYVGPNIGVTYLIYNTLSKTKSDIILNVGGHGGGIYTYSPKWGFKGELGFARGIGALVTSTTIQLLIGATYSL